MHICLKGSTLFPRIWSCFEHIVWSFDLKVSFFLLIFNLNHRNCFNFQNHEANWEIKYFLLLYMFNLWLSDEQISVKIKLLEQKVLIVLFVKFLLNFLNLYERWFESDNCLLNYDFLFLCVIHVLILVKLTNWSKFVWLLLLSLWIVSFIYGYLLYSIIWVDLRFGLFIDWICFKNMFIMIGLQLHVWVF